MNSPTGAPEKSSFESRLHQAIGDGILDIQRGTKLNAAQAGSILRSAMEFAKGIAKDVPEAVPAPQVPPQAHAHIVEMINATNRKSNTIVRETHLLAVRHALTGGGIAGKPNGLSERTAQTIAELLLESISGAKT